MSRRVMSTIFPYTVACGLCGKESTQHSVGSYSTFGGPDLDGRPASMLRGTMPHWVKECPLCGYVRDSLGDACELDRETLLRTYHTVESDYDWPAREPLVQEPRYEIPAFMRRTRFFPDSAAMDSLLSLFEEKEEPSQFPMGKAVSGPDLAKRFAKFGAMLAAIGASGKAAQQFLRAAWIFDDERDIVRAAAWRRAAIERAEFALEASGPASPGDLFCVLADMLRRCGEFQRVLDLEPLAQLTRSEERLLRFQKCLAERGDAGAHSEDELPEEYDRHGARK